MKKIAIVVGSFVMYLASSCSAFAAANDTINSYTNSTLTILTVFAGAAVVFFLVKGGYLYITSTGKPEALEKAKRTIRNAILGLLLVLAASFIISSLTSMMFSSSNISSNGIVQLSDITPAKPADGLTQVMIDAVSGLMQNFVQSATQPVVNAIFTFLSSTPDLLSNQVVFHFWLTMLGITDSLFVIIVALLGLHVMSAETLGFEEVEMRRILPRIGIAFLGANSSLFLANYVIITCNALTKAVIDSTGGLNQAWIVNAITFQNISNTQTMALVALVFFVIFLILAMILLFFYISRLIFISLGAVLSPFIFLLWTLPKFSDFAEISVKSYIVSVFTIFIHIVVIQLASSFLTFSPHSDNSILSIAVAIGLFFVLLKIPQIMIQLVFYTSGIRSIGKLGGSIVNILTASNISSDTRSNVQQDVQSARAFKKQFSS